MEFTYIVTYLYQSKEDGTLISIHKEFANEVEEDEYSYYVPFYLNGKEIDNQMLLEVKKNYDLNDLDYISKIVKCNNDRIDIRWAEDEDKGVSLPTPDIEYEITPVTYKPLTPTNLRGTIQGNSIIWTWDKVKDANYKLLNEFYLPIYNGSNNYYIEQNVKPGDKVYRRIISYTVHGESDYSPQTSIEMPLEYVYDLGLDKYTIEDTNIAYKSNISRNEEDYDGKAELFKSGIGDRCDLQIFTKPKNEIFERFKIKTTTSAYGNKEMRVYLPVDVEYYIRAKGLKIIEGESIADYSFRLIPYPVYEIFVNMKSYIMEPLSFVMECKLNVFYQVPKVKNCKMVIKGYNTSPKQFGLDQEVRLIMTDTYGEIDPSEFSWSVDNKDVSINNKGGISSKKNCSCTVKAIYKSLDIEFTKEIIFSDKCTFVYEDKELPIDNIKKYSKKKTTGYRVAVKEVMYKSNYQIKDKCTNDILENLEDVLKKRDSLFLISPKKTIQVSDFTLTYCSDPDIKFGVSGNNLVCTYNEGKNIYNYNKNIKQKAYKDSMLSNTLVNGNKIIYRNKYNVVYEGNNLPTSYFEYGNIPDDIHIYDNEANSSPESIIGKLPFLYIEQDIKYNDIIISEKGSQGKKYVPSKIFFDLDKSIEEVVVEVIPLNIDGNIKITTDNNMNLIENKYIRLSMTDDNLCIGVLPKETYEPFEEKSKTITCIVNGNSPYLYDYSGKKDYVEYAPVFVFPFRTKDVEYEAIVTPWQDKRIEAVFKNGNKYHTTIRNGDLLTLSCNDEDTLNQNIEQILFEDESEFYDIYNLEETTITVTIYNPRYNPIRENCDLKRTTVTLVPDNPNIELIPNKIEIDFSKQELNKIDLEVKCKIKSPNKLSWFPYIMSGYYYFHNKEYYLFEETNIIAEFNNIVSYYEKEFFVKIIANIKTKNNEQGITTTLSNTYFNSGECNDTVIENGIIKLNYEEVLGNRYYLDYGEYTTYEIILGNDIQNVTVSVEGEYLDYVIVLMDVADENGKYSGYRYVGIDDKYEQDTPISKVKIKLLMERLIEEDAPYSDSKIIKTKNELTRNGYSSSNILLEDNMITQKKLNKKGTYTSPIFTVIEGSSHIFVEPLLSSNSYTDYELQIRLNNSNFKSFDDKVELGDTSTYQFRLVLNINSKISVNGFKITTYYSNTGQVSVSPSVKAIHLYCVPNEWSYAGTITKSILGKIKCNTEWQFVSDYSVMDIIYPEVAVSGITKPKIQNIICEIDDPDIELMYQFNSDSRLVARSIEVQEYTTTSNYLKINEDHTVVVTPTPKQGAPVILIYNNISLVCVSDWDNEVSTWIEENIEVKEKESISFAYPNIDFSTLEIESGFYNEDGIIYSNNSGIVHVRYKVKYSFAINRRYNESSAKIDIHLDNSLEESEYQKIEVFYETGSKGYKPLTNIELNPLYNNQNNGFIYLSNSKLSPYKLNLYLDKYDLNVDEEVGFIIKVSDKYNNPVSSIPIRIETDYGIVNLKENISNEYGIITGKYISPSYMCEDKLLAFIGDNNIEVKHDIYVNNELPKFKLNVDISNYLVANGETITITAVLFNSNLEKLKDKEIVIEGSSIERQTALTDEFGKVIFTVIPIGDEEGLCTIYVSYLDILEEIVVEVE